MLKPLFFDKPSLVGIPITTLLRFFQMLSSTIVEINQLFLFSFNSHNSIFFLLKIII